MNFEILVATNNKHKLQEIRKILSPHKITVYGISDLNFNVPEILETGSSYFENALIKANALKAYTTMPIMADDSGLEILALDKKPGLYSARYAEEQGGHQKAMEKLIEELKGKDRAAQFICDIVVVNIEDKPLRFEAIVPGKIADDIQGINGFGYDPIFICDELGKRYADLNESEKNTVSHRAKALKKLLTYLRINNLAK